MPAIHRFALVTHSPHEMFELVRDVRSYPLFLTWIRSADVHEETDEYQLASLELRVAGMRQSFTTRNTLQEGQRMTMRLHSGPFDQLFGEWRFDALGRSGARVSLDLEFSLPTSVLMAPFRRGFSRMADSMVDDFCRRADQIHG
jgi:ribosome-associated toxin RatA of RatAB toxin-antitoxin module